MGARTERDGAVQVGARAKREPRRESESGGWGRRERNPREKNRSGET